MLDLTARNSAIDPAFTIKLKFGLSCMIYARKKTSAVINRFSGQKFELLSTECSQCATQPTLMQTCTRTNSREKLNQSEGALVNL